MEERRKDKRKTEIKRVLIEYLAEIPIEKMKRSSYTLMEDISLGGLKLISEKPFPIGQVMKVSITFKENPEPIHMIAKVKWTKIIDEKMHELGLEIVDTFEESIRILMAHLYGKSN
jgi:hypothetical protein